LIQNTLGLQKPIDHTLEHIYFQVYKAGLEHALLDIRNHASVRTFMADPNEISLEDHLRWVESNLDPDCHHHGQTQLAFIMVRGHPRGFVLVRDINENSGEVGIMIRESDEVLGLGAVVAVLALEKLCFNYLGLKAVSAKASPHNSKVLRILRGLGGEEVEMSDEKSLWFTYRVTDCRSNKVYQYILKRYGHQGELVF